MPTRVGTKAVNGRRVACTSSSGPSGKLDRLYPECRSKAAFLKLLQTELDLQDSTSFRDVARDLRTKTWDGKRWRADVAS
jgi:hypothetical protein